MQRIRTALGGRAAEMVYDGEEGYTSGASGDLQTATRLARLLLGSYGMDKDFGLAAIESAEFTKEMRERVNQILERELAEAIKVIEKDDLNNLDYECDYYLLDSKISGSGKSFDWSLIKDLDKPFFLAGGIDLDNLDEAMSKADYGIDVSSGVETNGIKDRNKIIEIVRRTKNGNR